MAKGLSAEDFELPYDDDGGASNGALVVDGPEGSYADSDALDLDLDLEEGEEPDDLDLGLDDDGDTDEADESEDEAPLARKPAAADNIEQNKGLKGRLNEYQQRGHKQGYSEGYAAAAAAFDAKMAAVTKRLEAMEGTSIDSEAQALAVEKNLDLEDAKLLIRARRGLPQQAEQTQTPTQQRDDKGRFIATATQPGATVPPEIEAHAAKLITQAETIKRTTGLDVLELYKTNPKVKEAINSRKYDFNDVARAHERQSGSRRVPSTARSTTAEGFTANDILRTSDEQFDKLDRYLEQGGRIRSNPRRRR